MLMLECRGTASPLVQTFHRGRHIDIGQEWEEQSRAVPVESGGNDSNGGSTAIIEAMDRQPTKNRFCMEILLVTNASAKI